MNEPTWYEGFSIAGWCYETPSGFIVVCSDLVTETYTIYRASDERLLFTGTYMVDNEHEFGETYEHEQDTAVEASMKAIEAALRRLKD